MKFQTTITVIAATAIALASASAFAQERRGDRNGANAQERAQVERGQRDFGSDRMRKRDRIHEPAHDRDRVRDQDRTKQPEVAEGNGQSIYGAELMNERERNQYREQLRLTESDPQARNEFLARHREMMQKRAKAQGKDIVDPPQGEN